MQAYHPITAIALALSALACAPGYAAPCTGVSLGASQTSDFTLGGVNASYCVVSTVNPDQGANGNSSGFAGSPPLFGTGWSLLAKMTSETSPETLGGVEYAWSITGSGVSLATSKSGTWSFGADESVKLDLVVAMHASNRSAAFLFDDIVLTANQPEQGTWQVKWLNNGGQVPNFSNASLWIRDVGPAPEVGTLASVPEPGTYVLVLAGLAGVGLVRRRRNSTG